jgi:hypothetical protein
MQTSINWNDQIDTFRRHTDQERALRLQAEQDRLASEELRIAGEQKQAAQVLVDLQAREKLLGLREAVWGLGQVFDEPGIWSEPVVIAGSASKATAPGPEPSDVQRLDLQPISSGCSRTILELTWPKYWPTTKTRSTGYRWAYMSLEHRALVITVVYRGEANFSLFVRPRYAMGAAPTYDMAQGEYDPGGFKLTISAGQRPEQQLDEMLIQDSINRKYKFEEIPYAATAMREATEAAAKLESLQANHNHAQWSSWVKEFFKHYPLPAAPTPAA